MFLETSESVNEDELSILFKNIKQDGIFLRMEFFSSKLFRFFKAFRLLWTVLQSGSAMSSPPIDRPPRHAGAAHHETAIAPEGNLQAFWEVRL